MLSLAAPWWLLGALAVPLVAWLHRYRLEGTVFAVSALFPWQGVSDASAPGRRLAEPDPLWRLRGAAVALLCLALAGPSWRVAVSPLEVWVDDSFSLQAMEAGGSRLEQGVERLVDALAERPPGEVHVRSLSNPARSLLLTDMSRSERRENLRAWLRPTADESRPPAAVHMSDAEHWLLSDGASPLVADWLESVPVSRLIQIGSQTENAALTLLSARPALAHTDAWLVLAAVTNLGREGASRQLLLQADGEPVERVELELPPERTAFVSIGVPRQVRRVEATLLPPDALPQDDRLVLPLPSRTGVLLDPRCGETLRTVLAVHPGLTMVEDGDDAVLTVSCGDDAEPWSAAHLFVRASGQGVGLPGSLQWHPEAGDLRHLPLQRQDLRAVPSSAGAIGGSAWLTAEDAVLVAADLDAGFIELFIDVESAALARQAYFPVLLSGLLERLAGRPLLELEASIGHPPDSSRIAPTALQLARHAPPLESLESRRNLSQWVLMAAIALVGWDLSGIWRRRRGY